MLVHFRSLLAILVTVVLIAGCSQTIATQAPQTFQASEGDRPTQDWRSSSPEAQGMDSSVLAAMLDTIQHQNYEIDSVTVVRNGFLILDAAIYPYDQDTKHFIRSCTKSIVSLLIGIAIDQGYIEDVQTPVLEFFPGRSVDNLDADKERMTLENLLTMTTGFRCRDSYLYRWSGLYEIRESDDWVQFVLDLPMAETPGTKFEYCNGSSFLLSAIITETTGMSALEFTEKNLFGPLGIHDVIWSTNPQGINIGWSDLRMLPHDMAKIGYLYLRGGQWEGKQIIPSSWVEASTRKHIPATLEDGYGYQWWVDDSGIYMALGYGGQFIFVVPEKDMVVVFTSDLPERDFYVPQVLLDDYIIPAAISSEPIPEDPAAQSSLELLIEDLSNP
ncbi:MAG: serine hydrolase [Anaerolineales bacterium]|nr:serine hydrolase [Anaerolineales bacterium]